MRLFRALTFTAATTVLLVAVGWHQLRTHDAPPGAAAIEPVHASDIPLLRTERLVALSGMPAAYRVEEQLQVLTVRDGTGEVPVVYPIDGGPIALVRTGDEYMVTGIAVPERARPVVIGSSTSDLRAQRRSDTVLRIGQPVSGSFAVSVRSSPSLSTAAEFAQEFSRHGYPLFISPARTDGGYHYRVLVGPYESQQDAEADLIDVRWEASDAFLVLF